MAYCQSAFLERGVILANERCSGREAYPVLKQPMWQETEEESICPFAWYEETSLLILPLSLANLQIDRFYSCAGYFPQPATK